MKRCGGLRFILVAALASTIFAGCGGGGSDNNDQGEVLFKGQEQVAAANMDFFLTVRDPGTGTLTALLSWDRPQRVEAIFHEAATGTPLTDVTSLSPFEVTCNTTTGHSYGFGLINPDPVNAVVVDYTITFEAQ